MWWSPSVLLAQSGHGEWLDRTPEPARAADEGGREQRRLVVRLDERWRLRLPMPRHIADIDEQDRTSSTARRNLEARPSLASSSGSRLRRPTTRNDVGQRQAWS